MAGQPSAPSGDAPPGPIDRSRFVRLQEELIAVRTRLDRQIAQLTQLNRISNALLLEEPGEWHLLRFAETIPEVLDMAIGVVWELRDGEVLQLAACGLEADAAVWRRIGLGLLPLLREAPPTTALRLDAEMLERLGGTTLCDVLICPCISLDGEWLGLTLAANTRNLIGMAEPISDETLAVFSQIAERFASFLFNIHARRVQTTQLEQLQASEERLQRVLRSTSDGWWDWDLNSDHCLLSSRWVEMLGGSGQEPQLQQGFWLDRVHPGARESFSHGLRQALEGEVATSLNLEVELRRDDNRYLPVLVRGTTSRGTDGQARRFSGTIIDLSERRRHEAHLQRLAFHDTLTDLPNKHGLLDVLPQVISEHRGKGQVLAVLVINLDGYKNLNDTHGPSAGDQILPIVAGRLRQTLRGSDLIVRWGGDEFVVVLCEMGTEESAAEAHALRVAQGLLERLSQPYQLQAGIISHHSASLGVALLDDRSPTAEALLQHAGTALSEAKARGRSMVRLFESTMQVMRTERSRLEQELHRAFEQDELCLNYQGIVDRDGRLCGAEALTRWLRPGTPGVSPERFIPVAENSGFIHRLGDWSLIRIQELLQQWDGQLRTGFRVSLNLSARQFLHPLFADRMLTALEARGVPAGRLRLEITEATVLDDLDKAAERMNRLRDRGLEFSLDDFGTGYSSISYLRDLPLSEVKLDKRYVRNFLHNRNDAAILQAVLILCHTMGIRLVAEGVESDEQWQRLRDLGCDRFQGFLFSRPREPGTEPASLLLPRWQQPGPALRPPS